MSALDPGGCCVFSFWKAPEFSPRVARCQIPGDDGNSTRASE